MPPREHPITLQDIARRANVSKMTVSMALRGHPHVAVETRTRLRALAEEMGYRPNPLVVANMALLRSRRRTAFAGTLAFVGMGDTPRVDPPADQQGRVYFGAKRRAEALGFQLEWFATDPAGCNGRRLSGILTARGILGVILGANCLLPTECHLDWAQFALAAIGRTEVGHELHRTTGDSYRAVCDACLIARARGYRRIGLAVSREHHIAHHGLHRSAFLGCQVEWPAEDHVPVLIAEGWAEKPFLDWFLRHRPEVVMACDDSAMPWLTKAGFRIPQDVGLIRPHITNDRFGIAGFLFNDVDVGSAAVDLVVEQLNHNERGLPDVVKRVLLRGQWIEGRSLRPPPEK